MALTDSLIAWWKMDEASGNALDAHGSNTLTQLGGTLGAGTGKVNGARDFAGAGGAYLYSNDTAALSTGDIDFTFACWVKADTLPGSLPGIITKWNGGGSEEYGLYYYNVPNVFYWAVSHDGTAQTQVAGAISASASTWYFIVCWHDATANTTNIQMNNGTPVSAAHSTGVVDGGSLFYIGYLGATGGIWDGLIDEIGFWKRVLTTDERTYLYNGGAGRAYEDLIPTPPTITTTTLPGGTTDEPYSETLAATGGSGAITWSVTAGALPDGLALNSSTGEISGTPTTIGTASFTVEAEDTAAATDTQALSIVIVGLFGIYEFLQITPGLRIESIAWTGAVLRASFGRGFGAKANVGGIEGLQRWSIHSGGIWWDGLDDMTIGGVSRFEYYWEFFKRHTTGDQEVFVIKWRQNYYHVQFADVEMSVEKFKNELIYQGGFEVIQRRVSGETYNDDGSLPVPDLIEPTVPGGLAVSEIAIASITLGWTASTDEE